MPVNEAEVMQKIHSMGYGRHSQYGMAFALNIEGKQKRKHSGKGAREPFGDPIPQAQLNKILDAFDEGSEQECAQFLVDCCRGKVTSEQLANRLRGASVSQEDVARQIKEGIASGVKEAIAALGLDAETVALLKAKAATKRVPPPKKPKGPKPVEPQQATA